MSKVVEKRSNTSKIPATLTRASVIKSNYVRRYQLTAKYGFKYSYELVDFLTRRETRAKRKNRRVA
jgi:hypothetical protein